VGGLGSSQTKHPVENGFLKLQLLNTAEDDLVAGFEFYEKQRAGLGEYFLDSLFSDIDSLLIFFGSHPEVFGHYRALSKRFPFAIYYQINGEIIKVKAVLDVECAHHGSEDRLKGRFQIKLD